MDFPDLIAKKRDVILTTPQLKNLIDPCESLPSAGGVFLRGDNYLALGCDLENIARLDDLLATAINISKCLILCTAEVSITYMKVEAADALIKWAAHFEDGMRNQSFCTSSVPN